MYGKYNEYVASINDAWPTEQDMYDIRHSICINCEKDFEFRRKVLFVRVERNELLWWHSVSEKCVHVSGK